MFGQLRIISFFFFNDTATTEIYTLSLHDALPICEAVRRSPARDEPAARSGAPDVRSRATCQERTRPRQPRIRRPGAAARAWPAGAPCLKIGRASGRERV